MTHEFYKELMELAKNKTKVDKNTFARLTRELLCTIHLKNPHRQEIWGLFTHGHYIDAAKGGDAAYPYVDTSQTRSEGGQGRVMDTEAMGRVYVRNPHQADPGVTFDPLHEDAREDGEPRNLRVGRCTNVTAHKTGANYPAYVFFTLYDMVYLRAYEEVRFNFLTSIGQNPSDHSRAFFCNSVGEPYINRKRSLDWTRFMMINQCGSFKGHTARKIVSDYVKKQNNAVLDEGRQYLMCNSDQVDKDSYQSKLRKRAYAMVAGGTYRSVFLS